MAEIDDRLGQVILGSSPSASEAEIKRFNEFCSRARRRLKNALMIETSAQGIWVITGEGRRNLVEDETSFIRLVTARHSAHRRGGRADPDRTDEVTTAETTEPQVTNEPSMTWKEHLLAILKSMHPTAFEHLCQRILRESGFIEVRVTGQTNDGGIDGRGILKVGLLTFRVIFQCKRYHGTVGSSVVRDFRGAMAGRTDKGLIITTGSFTADARREATRDGAPAIDLIDGEALCDLLKDLKIGVTVEMVPEVTVDAAAFAAF